MNFLGPIGLTLALAWVLCWSLSRIQRIPRSPLLQSIAGTPNTSVVLPTGIAVRLDRIADFRLILIGTLVPDLIDKPLAFLIDPGFVNNSLRSVGHSVVGGVVMLAVVWMATRGWQKAAVSSFGFGFAIHLLTDRMWEMPEAVLWPALGWVFPEGDVPFSHWYRVHFSQLPTSLADLAGIGVLLVFVGYLIGRKSVSSFLKKGQFV